MRRKTEKPNPLKYTHPDDKRLRRRRQKLAFQREYYEKRFRTIDMLLHAVDTTIALRKEKQYK
jgi:hypothetical protein